MRSTLGYGGVLALALTSCAHQPTVAEQHMRAYEEKMYDYCESPESLDEDGKPDEACGRFYEDQIGQQRGRRNHAAAAVGAGLKAMSGSPSTSCTSTRIGNTERTDCD